MPDTSPIDLARAVLAANEAGSAPPPEAAAWQAAYLRTYIARAEAGDPISMERAAGLGAPGRPNWVRAEERTKRDARLREIHRTEFPGMEVTEAARRIRAKYRRTMDLPGHRQLVNVLRKFAACM